MSEELEEIQAGCDALDLEVAVCQVGRFVFVFRDALHLMFVQS